MIITIYWLFLSIRRKSYPNNYKKNYKNYTLVC